MNILPDNAAQITDSFLSHLHDDDADETVYLDKVIIFLLLLLYIINM